MPNKMIELTVQTNQNGTYKGFFSSADMILIVKMKSNTLIEMSSGSKYYVTETPKEIFKLMESSEKPKKEEKPLKNSEKAPVKTSRKTDNAVKGSKTAK